MDELIQYIINGVGIGAIYGLIALGYTMVYGVLQLINFAHSDVYMIGSFTAYYINRWMGWYQNSSVIHFLFLLLSSLLVAGMMAVIVERLAYRPLRAAPKINLLITAIGVSFLLQNLGQIFFGADPKFFQAPLENFVVIQLGNSEILFYDVFLIMITMISLLILHFLIYKTQIGRAMRAVSVNATAASLLGISVNRVVAFTFFLGGALAGIASVLVPLKYPKIDPLMGTLFGLKAFVAAVFGGIGNLGGAVLGAFVLGLMEQLVSAYLSSTYRDAIAFLILIAVLLFKPEGLLGNPRIEKI